MIKKVQVYLNIVLVLFSIVAIIYFIGTWIVGLFKERNIVTKENLNNYIIEENLVTSYSLFNILEKCTTNLYEAMVNGSYNDIYTIVGSDTKANMSRDEIITLLKNYSTNIFGTADIMSGSSVTLKKVYTFEKKYIAEINSTFSQESLFIIYDIDLYNLTYKIDLIV